MPERLGVFGGTFDPPHLGHLILASEARYQLGLTKVLWLPAAVPPHKLDNAITALEDRLSMLRLALEGEETFAISTIDIDRPGPHFTLDAVSLLRAEFPAAEMVLLIGGDSLRDLPDWHRPRDLILALDAIGVMRRPGDDIDVRALEATLPGLSARLRFVEAPLLEISSREIRDRAARNLPFKYYVPRAVHDYIASKRLYRLD